MAASKPMKRLFPTSLALLLVLGSLGHVFAAAFCPRMLGHDCCLTKTSGSQNPSQSHQHMHAMAMDRMANESMQVDDGDMQGMVMEDASVSAHSSASSEEAPPNTADESPATNTLELPIDACTHCMSHSGVQNAPVSSVGVRDQSSEEVGSVPLRVTRLFARPSMTLEPIGLPREHAPPGNNASRHILLNVFLI